MRPNRGSLEMLRGQLGEDANIPESVLHEIGKLTDKEAFKLRKIFPIGIVLPDGVRGTVRTTPEDMSEALTSLVHRAGLSVHVFPYGVPVVDEIDIHFETFNEKQAGS